MSKEEKLKELEAVLDRYLSEDNEMGILVTEQKINNLKGEK